jgi:hypothetical protein
LKVQGEFTLKPQTIQHLSNHTDSNYNLRKPSKLHDFSLVLSKHDNLVVVACTDYPRCDDTITIFGLRG